MKATTTLASAAALLLLTAMPVSAQEDLDAKLEKKLKAGWINSPKWITDYEQAKAESKKTGKVIFAYFTRSYSY